MGSPHPLLQALSCYSSSSSDKLRRCSSLLGLEALEAVDLNVLDERVELLLGVLVLVSLAGDSDAQLAGDVSDTSGPDHAVQLGVNAHLLYKFPTNTTRKSEFPI